MSQFAFCPNVHDLERLANGSLRDDLFDPIVRHLEKCPACATRIPESPSKDTLIDALQSAMTMSGSGDYRRVQPIIDKLVAAAAQPIAAHPAKSPADETIEGKSRIDAASEIGDLLEFLAPAERSDELGRLGQYRVLQVLGSGGMGVVFRAEDPHLERPVALKAMLPKTVANTASKQRFFREARAAAALKHPNIVSIYQVGEDRGTPYLAMELLEGESLNARLCREPVLPIRDVLQIGGQIAEALAAAHSKDLIHRDIKPGNIWLEATDDAARTKAQMENGGQTEWAASKVKILDFGLARTNGDDVQLTHAGTIVGTPAYMAPEQARCQKVDHRADLFSLGVVLYRMTTGQLPFAGNDTMSVLSSLAMDTPSEPRTHNRTIPAALNDLIVKLLEKDPAKRPASAREVAATLVAIASASNSADSDALVPSSQDLSPRQTSPRRRWLVPAIVVLVLAFPAAVWLAAGVIFRVETEHGTLVVKVDDPNIAVRIEQGNQVILDEKDGKRSFVVAAGKGKVLIHDKASPNLTLAMREFEILRGKEKVVEITLEELKEARAKSTPPAPGSKDEPKNPPKIAKITPAPVVITPKVDERPAGAPLSPIALVSRPTPIKGVLGWTIETRESRGRINAVAISPGDRWLATAGDDGTIRLFDFKTYRLANALIGHADKILTIAWSPNGRYLASGGVDQSIRIWDVESGRLLRVLNGHGATVRVVAWSPDGKSLGSGSEDHTLRIWDSASGDARHILTARGSVVSMAWSPDSSQLVSAIRNSEAVRLWDTQTGKVVQNLDHKIDQGSLTQSVAWSPDGKKVVGAGHGGKFRIWDSVSGKIERDFSVDQGTCLALAWSGSNLISVSHGSAIGLWDSESGTLIRKKPGDAYAVSASSDGKLLAVSDRFEVHVVSVADLKTIHSLESHRLLNRHDGNDTDNRAVAWSPNGKQVASFSYAQTACLWDTSSGKLAHHLKGTGDEINALAWSPDGRKLAAGCVNKDIPIWDALTGKRIATVPTEPHSGSSANKSLAWEPRGQFVAAGFLRAGVWDAQSGNLKFDLPRRSGATNSSYTNFRRFAWSPSARLASVDAQMVTFWDGHTGARLRDVPVHRATLCMAWSPNGKILARGGDKDTLVQLLDAETGKVAGEFRTHTGPVEAVAWSNDGKTLVSLNAAGKVDWWNVNESGAPIKSADVPHGRGVFSSNLHYLACPGYNATYLWDLDAHQPRGALVALNENISLAIHPSGHFRGTASAPRSLVYVVQTEQGVRTLSPDEFHQSYGWQNDPARVDILK